MRQQGTVRDFGGTYGFIKPLPDGPVIFVHQSDIQMDGYRQLFRGDVVEYEVEQGDRGSHAVRVKCIQSAQEGEGVTLQNERGN